MTEMEIIDRQTAKARGAVIVALTADTAAIGSTSGAVFTYRNASR
jgi:hypothetical protein